MTATTDPKYKPANAVAKTMSEREFLNLLDAARTKTKQVMDRARASVVLDHPFFYSTMLKKPMIESLVVPTMGVTPRGQIYYNPFFVATMTTDNQTFVICHELLHYLSGHEARFRAYIAAKGLPDNKDTRLTWNKAGDYWINDTLVEAKVGDQPPGSLEWPGSHARTVEQIMDDLLKEQKQNGGKNKDKYKAGGEGGALVDDMQGDQDGEGKLTEAELEEIEGERKMDVTEAAQIARMKGKLPGVLGEFAADTIESRVPWYDILEQYMTDRVRTDYSWARPNRRYMPDNYLPQIDGVGAMGPIVIQIDISGSVSQREIEHYNGHLKRIVEQCHPSKVHVLYTDTQVQRHEEFDNPTDVNIEFYSGGGTDMEAGFEYVRANGIEAEVFVCLSDGFTTFSAPPSFPVIWCISTDVQAPYGLNINFKVE